MDGVVAVLEVLQLLRSMARPLPNAPTRGGLRVAGVGRADVRVCLVGCLHGRGARAIARVEPEDMTGGVLKRSLRACLSRERRAGFRPVERGISSASRAARVCGRLSVTLVCPAAPRSQLRPEAGPCRRSASAAPRAGAQRSDVHFRGLSVIGTSGVSRVGEGPRTAGTRRPPVQDRITHPGRLTRPRANHSQHVEQRVAPRVLSPCPAATRASIVTCWRPCALLARSIRA